MWMYFLKRYDSRSAFKYQLISDTTPDFPHLLIIKHWQLSQTLVIDQRLELRHPYQYKLRKYVLIKGGTACVCVSLKTICMDHAYVDMCFDWQSINSAGWLPGKLTADRECTRVCARVCVHVYL